VPRCHEISRSLQNAEIEGLLVGSESTYFKSYKTGNLGVPNTLDLPFLDIFKILKSFQ
jgi:hypothetical protein